MLCFCCLLVNAISQFDTYGREAPESFEYHNKEFTAAAVSGMRHANISKEEIEKLIQTHPQEDIIFDNHITLITDGCSSGQGKCRILSVLRR